MDIAQYKAILFDLDKTLTNMKQEITPATAQVLKKLNQKMRTGLCTGRHFSTLKDRSLIHFLPESTHVVSGGAQVITATGEILWQKLIPIKTARQLIKQIDDGRVKVYFQTRDQIYGNQLSRQLWATDHQGTNIESLIIAPLEDFPDSGVPHLVIKHISQDIADYLQAHPSFNVKVMTDYDGKKYADVMTHGVDKTVGIKHWCQINNIQPEEIIGFGDSENDLEFLSYIGYAVAMGNSVENVKQIADEVIGSCDEDGVAQWVGQNIKSE